MIAAPAMSMLIAALIQVESRGHDSAIGARGEVGCLQIRPAVIADVNRIQSRYVFTLADRLSHDRSVAICRIYLNHYCTAERIGREPTIEDAARCWQGGPQGWRKPATRRYWTRVLAAMKEL